MRDRPHFKTAYYSDFWYSRHFRLNEATAGAAVVQNEIEQHLFRLRILSFFFQSIYIPRTHLITGAFSTQYKIADTVINTRELDTLVATDTVRISLFPGLDGKEDTLRILERQTEAPDVVYPNDSKYLSRIPDTGKLIVDTSAEAFGNTITFPLYGDLLESYNPEIGRRYKEIVRGSHLKDVPFFHERFLRRIKDEMPREIFDAIWRNTNSIYLTSGAPEHADLIAYFNEEIEHSSFRFEPHGIDRYLFSPASLYTFLGIFFDTIRVSKIIYDDMRITHRPLLDDTMRKTMETFRRDYQEIAWTISQVTRQGRLRHDLDQQGLKAIFELALDGDRASLAKLAQEALADAERASTAYGGLVGLIGSVVNSGARYGSRFFKERLRRRRFPGLYDFIDRLTASTGRS